MIKITVTNEEGRVYGTYDIEGWPALGRNAHEWRVSDGQGSSDSIQDLLTEAHKWARKLKRR